MKLGGSLAAAHQIYKDLRRYADTTGTNIVTFGQEKALGAGYYLLTAGFRKLMSGDTIVAEPSCLIGDIGASYKRLDCTALYHRLNISQTNVISSQ